jgi:hypothetical protein
LPHFDAEGAARRPTRVLAAALAGLLTTTKFAEHSLFCEVR